MNRCKYCHNTNKCDCDYIVLYHFKEWAKDINKKELKRLKEKRKW